MNGLTDYCSVTNKTTSGSYNYYLFSRIDNYAVILREKTDGLEYLFKVIVPSEDVDTIWAAATSQTYIRPDQASDAVKRYVINKLSTFLKSDQNKSIVDSW